MWLISLMCVIHLAIHHLASVTGKSAAADATTSASEPALLTLLKI